VTRYALRTDANQTAVVSALVAAGALVDVIGKPVDLLVGGINSKGEKRLMFMEVKDGQKTKSGQNLTPAQVKFFDRWGGYSISLVDGPEAALRAYRVLIA